MFDLPQTPLMGSPRSPHPNGDMCSMIDACRSKAFELADLTVRLSTEWATVRNSTLETDAAVKYGITSPRSPRLHQMLPAIPYQKAPSMDSIAKPQASHEHVEISDDSYAEEDDVYYDSSLIEVSTDQRSFTTVERETRERSSIKEFSVKREWFPDDSGESVAGSIQLDLAARSIHNCGLHRRFSLGVNDDDDEEELTAGVSRSRVTVFQPSGYWRFVVSSPSSSKRITWEMVGIVSILYDMVALPLTMCFDVPKNLLTDITEWFSRIFWTLNVAVALTTGFVSNDTVVMDRHRIFINYCKTWLIVDLITVLPDWIFYILGEIESEDGNSAGSLVKVLRFLRLFRLARLLRLAKLREAWQLIHDLIDSEKVGILLEVIKNILVLVVVNHYIACVWFAVGSAQEHDSWLKAYSTTNDTDWGRQFLAAYHWSITQFASSVDIFPRSPSERAYAINVVIFGMVGFSYLVGSIASSLARLQQLNETRATSLWMLRKFLKQKQVPHELCLRIRCYVANQWERQDAEMTSSSVEILGLLSENLKSDLTLAINAPALIIHPLLYEVHTYLQGTIRRLMLDGISDIFLAPKDIMFTAGEKATHMSLLTSGTMHYDRMHLEINHPEKLRSKEDWIAEPVLWVSGWINLGDLRARTASTLLQIDPEKLNSVAKLNPLAFMLMSEYSKEYTKWLNSHPTEEMSDITQGEDVTIELEQIIEFIAHNVPFRSHNGVQDIVIPQGTSVASGAMGRTRALRSQ